MVKAEHRYQAIIPRRFRDASLYDIEGDVATKISDWVGTRAGNLVLTGPVGTGKTHAAVAAARLLWGEGIPVQFVPEVELLDGLRPSAETPLTLIPDRVLILDDLGASKITDWTVERLYSIINRRWLDELPIIATTNLGRDGLTASLGARTVSRLQEGATIIKLGGPDRRAA